MGNRPSRVSRQRPASTTTEASKDQSQTRNISVLSLSQKQTVVEFSLAGRKLHLTSATDVLEHVTFLNRVKGIQRVDLSGNTLGVEASKALAAALKLHPEIIEVNLFDCFTGRLKEEVPPALEAFGEMLKTRPELRRLDLSDNAFGPAGAQAVATFLGQCLKLEELRLNNNGLGPEGGVIIGKALLELSMNQIEASYPPTLCLFSCGRNRLESSSTEILARAFEAHSNTLEHVALYQDGIRPEGIVHLCSGLAKCSKLCFLDMQDNTFTESGSRALAEALPNWPNLHSLNVSDCLMGAKGSIQVLRALVCSDGDEAMKPLPLVSLQLQYNEINEVGAQMLADRLPLFIDSLKQLSLNGNSFDATGRAALAIISFLEKQYKRDILDEWDDMDYEEEEEEEESEKEEEAEKEESVDEEEQEQEHPETKEETQLEEEIKHLELNDAPVNKVNIETKALSSSSDTSEPIIPSEAERSAQ